MPYHVFISYRRRGASELAMLLYSRLSNDGYAPFLDLESMGSGMFNEQIYQRIDECGDMLILLPENAFERDENAEDWMRMEISYALRKGKNVIPVIMHGFRWPSKLPEEIASLRYRQGVEVNMEYFDAVYSKICSLLTYHPQEIRKRSKRIRSLYLLSACVGIGALSVIFLKPWNKPSDSLVHSPPLRPALSVSTVAPNTSGAVEYAELDKNIIYFGKGENGKLSWEILSSNESYTELISSACVTSRPFGTTTVWKDSSLRSWLNTDYLYQTFSPTEREAIHFVNGDAIRIPAVNEAGAIALTTNERYRATYFSMTICSDRSQMLYTVSPEGALGVSAPGENLGVRIVITVKNDLISRIPGSNFSPTVNIVPKQFNSSIFIENPDAFEQLDGE